MPLTSEEKKIKQKIVEFVMERGYKQENSNRFVNDNRRYWFKKEMLFIQRYVGNGWFTDYIYKLSNLDVVEDDTGKKKLRQTV